jgi:ribonuclease BN (tRNA processing enzyme)
MTRAGKQPLELCFLGTGNAFAPQRYWSSFLLNDRYLFDCPPTALAHLKKAGKPPEDIRAVFISHFHGDHFFGLPFLLLEYGELTPRSEDLFIVGPPLIQEKLETMTDLGFPGLFERSRGYRRLYVEAKDGVSGEAGDIRFRAQLVEHVGNLECFGYRVEIDGRAVAYSGDTVMSDALYKLADGADVFVVECSCWGPYCGPHLGPSDIRTLRKAIPPSTVFVLTHLDAGEGNLQDLEGIVLAEDFGVYRL